MRHLCFVLALSTCLFANAQVTITSADMPAVGDTFRLQRDTLPAGFSVGQGGVNRTWDFSNLTPDEPVITYAVAPSSTQYAADFPNANLALTNDFSAFLFYRNTAIALKGEGFANVLPNLGTVSVNFNPIPDQYHFQATYLTTFSGNSGFQEAKPYNQLPPNIQADINNALGNCLNPVATVSQVRVTFTSSYKDTIDGWGKVITPIATYDALRRKRIENTHTVIEVETNCLFITQWIAILDTTGTTIEHSWLSPITKLPLIALTYNDQRSITAVTYSTLPPLPVAGFTWSYISADTVAFTSTSQNADTYLWEIGGIVTWLQNPVIDFDENGTYIVCLTVTNESGSDTFCDSVYISGIDTANHSPVAVRDLANIIYPDTAHLDLMANDSDPDSDNITFGLAFSPLNGTVVDLGGGMVNYIPNISFSGVDSFNYTICDNGSPVMCDTGTAVVKVDTLFPTGGITLFQKEKIRILPNPVTTEVKIEIGNWNAVKVEVTDINGRILISQQSIFNPEEIIIDVSTLPQGFYICKLTGADGNVLAGKLLKQ